VTRLNRARDLVNSWERRHRLRPYCRRCPWRFPDWDYTHEDAASLALDGYPATTPRRKLPEVPRRYTVEVSVLAPHLWRTPGGKP